MLVPVVSKTLKPYKEFQVNTIVDGELVMDGLELRFMCFDCLSVCGEIMVQKTFSKRLWRLVEMVLKPVHQMMKDRSDLAQRVPFIMQLKKLQFSYHVEEIFKQIKTLNYENDGIIFTASERPCALGTDPNMYPKINIV